VRDGFTIQPTTTSAVTFVVTWPRGIAGLVGPSSTADRVRASPASSAKRRRVVLSIIREEEDEPAEDLLCVSRGVISP
jgi:hypothetical protein